MSRISWIIMIIIEIFLYINLAKAIYGENIKITKSKITVFALIVVLLCAMDYFLKVNISFLSLFLSVFIYSDTSIKRKIFNSLTVQIIAMGVQEFVTLFSANYSLMMFDTIIKLGDIYYICFMVIVAWVIRYLKEKVKIDLKDIPNYIYINTILGFCAGILPLYLMESLNDFISKKVQSLVFVIGGLAIILNLFSIYLFIKNYQEKNKYGQESKEKSELMKVQAQYLENTVKNYEYLRKFRHDMRGHIRILKTMCEDNPEALSYIEQMGEKINSTDVFKCSNSLVSAVLNTFGNELNDESIHHDIHYFVNGDIAMDDLELCSLLYNLTNNALEAERKADKEYRKIEVDIRGAGNHLFIIVKNDVSEDFNMDSITKKETTKNDKAHHGIGLHNIEDIVDKYDGYVDYSCEDGRIRAEVLLQSVVSMSKIKESD